MAMEFSRPDNARKLNRLRVLSAINENENLTRASLSTLLGLNKVSTGEIVSALIAEGYIEETGKLETRGGRPGTALRLKADSAVVLGCDIKTRSCQVAIFDLTARPLRSEQFPLEGIESAEELRDRIIRVAAKMVQLAKKKVLGMVIATSGNIQGQTLTSTPIQFLTGTDFSSLFEGCPFPVALESSLEAEAEAERFHYQIPLENLLLVNWGEHLASALILKDRILPNTAFAHMPVARTGLCHCGGIGCLETISSGYGIRVQAISQGGADISVREMMKNEERYKGLLEKAAQYLGRALINAFSATGARGAIITGGLANLPDYYYALLLDIVEKEGGPSFSQLPIYRSEYREKGSLQGAGVLALDRFFFQKNLLLSLGM